VHLGDKSWQQHSLSCSSWWQPSWALLTYRAVKIIPQDRAANVERFGPYRRTLEARLNFVVPVLNRVKPVIDLREPTCLPRRSRP
jgi:regulator of protease activity HflC (stomatin/prohibitin superfamily)